MPLARPALVAIAAFQLAFEPQNAGTPIIGVVEVPTLLNRYSPVTGEPQVPDNVRIALRARPAGDSAVIATITKSDDLATVEYRYEELAAAVHGRQDGWSLVRTAAGVAGWMSAEDAGQFYSLADLLDDRMAYLTDAWNGVLYASPGSADLVPIPDDPDRRLAGYVEPNVQSVRIVLQPGQDPEEPRRAYGATAMSARPGPDGTRILSLETGVLVPLFESSTGATVAAQVRTNRADEMLQTTHQTPTQVLVFETRPGWYQVAGENGGEWRRAPRLWLQASPVWRFQPVADGEPMRELAARAWGRESRDVRVLATRSIDGRLWAEIELLNGHDCGSAGSGAVRSTGWLPAHDSSGALNVWYYPRGC